MKKRMYIVLVICLISNIFCLASMSDFKSLFSQSDCELFTPKKPDDILKLFDAAITGDLATIKKYIKSGGNPNICNEQNNSLLICAYGNNQHDIVDYLLTCNSIDFSLCANDGLTIGHIAIIYNDLVSLKKFIQHGLSVNIRSSRTMESLIDKAYQIRNDKILYYLLCQKEIDVSYMIEQYEVFIDSINLVMKNGNVDVLDKIVRSMEQEGILQNVNFLIELASQHDQPQILDYLFNKNSIKKFLDIDTVMYKGLTLPGIFVANGNLPMLQRFIKNGLSKSHKESLLMLAYHRSQYKIVKYLLTQRDSKDLVVATVSNKEQISIFDYAVMNGDINIFHTALSSLNSTDIKRDVIEKALCSACGINSTEFIDYLFTTNGVREYVNVMDTKKDDCSAVDFAIKEGHLDVLKSLISYGLDVNLINLKGYPLLTYACHCKQKNIVNYLLNQKDVFCKIDFTLCDKNGQLAGHIAAEQGDEHTLNQLLAAIKKRESGNYLDAVDHQGRSMLRIGIENNNKKIVELLIKYEANILQDVSGWSAIDYVEQSGNNVAQDIKEIIHKRQVEPFESLMSSHRVIAENIRSIEDQEFSKILRDSLENKRSVDVVTKKSLQQQEAERKQKYSHQKKLLELDEQVKRQQLSSQNEYDFQRDIIHAFHRSDFCLTEAEQRAEIAQEEYMLWLDKKNQQGILTGIFPTFLRGIVRVDIEKTTGTKISKQKDDALKKMTIQELVQEKDKILLRLSQKSVQTMARQRIAQAQKIQQSMQKNRKDLVEHADLTLKALGDEENLNWQQMIEQYNSMYSMHKKIFDLVKAEAENRKDLYEHEELLQQKLGEKHSEIQKKQQGMQKDRKELIELAMLQKSKLYESALIENKKLALENEESLHRQEMIEQDSSVHSMHKKIFNLVKAEAESRKDLYEYEELLQKIFDEKYSEIQKKQQSMQKAREELIECAMLQKSKLYESALIENKKLALENEESLHRQEMIEQDSSVHSMHKKIFNLVKAEAESRKDLYEYEELLHQKLGEKYSEIQKAKTVLNRDSDANRAPVRSAFRGGRGRRGY